MVCICTKNQEFNFEYTGTEELFVVPCGGKYKLEAWGAQGGNSSVMQGGYGGYSIGHTNLNNYEKLFINVGGQGDESDVHNIVHSAVAPIMSYSHQINILVCVN